MDVAWYTEGATDSIVQYGTSPQLGWEESGGSKVYLPGHGVHHHALLSNLTAGVLYYYTVGDKSVRSKVYSFTAATLDLDANVSVNILGDWGWLGSDARPMSFATDGLVKNWSGEPSRRTMERLKDNKQIDMVWHVGDISYADDSYAHTDCVVGFCYEKVQNGFMNWIENVSSTLPYMVTVGNHESECHSPACVIDPFLLTPLGNFSAYNTRWHMPSRQSGGRASMWYSFDYGPVHFVGINTETDFPGAGEEKKGDGGITDCGSFGAEGEYIAWLEQDLKKANATGRWIIGGGHRPWHNGEYGGALGLLEKYGAAIYFAGHGHSYARSQSESGKVQTVMVGGAGCDEKSNVLDATSQKEWLMAAKSSGYSTSATATGVLDASRDRLSWRLIEGSTQKVIDTLVVTR